MSFQIGHASRNIQLRSSALSSYGFSKATPDFLGFTYAAIYPKDSKITADDLSSYGLGIEDIEKESDENMSKYDEDYFIGKVYHPEDQLWWDYITTHKSGYCGTSVIAPFWGTQDPFILHLVVLYALSIIVRYLPDTWYEIENGKLDYINALLENYLAIFDSVLPKLAVERLTKVNLVVTAPGSMNSPI
ncbi:hypothetical protein HM25_002827 [Salmonella enterica subsp. enterica serovar Carno]|nr:hypothetical protein [Salmonella enterica subsp. enterica]EDV9643081.1 hypothetical protein [Salmonella enterica subsp. enterica serovar Carno]